MDRFTKILSGSLLGLVALSGLHGQEVITSLAGNPLAREYHEANREAKKMAAAVTLELPLFDDFSSSFFAPDPKIWSDECAFINNNYGIDPVSNGVATLDAVNFDGSIYPNATIDPTSFVADHLTTHPINLTYAPGDSIYLSFFYQPGGLGDIPEEQDSLLVDFYAPGDSTWNHIWGIPGTGLHPFRQVMIPVLEERYLADGFRFRFRNRASLPKNTHYPDKRGNLDHWHLDYIRLDINRFEADTIHRDVAFITSLNSVLTDLTSLPWSHLEAAYNNVLDLTISVRYRNNDTISRNVTRSLAIEQPIYNESYIPVQPTAQDLPELSDTVVNFDYIFPPDFDFERGDSALLRFKASLRTDEFDPKVNDTVIHDQLFRDYYSYNDGTPEAGYGLRAGGTRNGSVAMKYFAYQPDLLGGVDISFNQLYDSLNLNYYFKLMVWSDNEGVPGSLLFEDDNEHTPVYTAHFPGFIRYHFTEPVPVDETFYVGWKQYNEFMLNVGLDLNNRPSPHVLFYNYQGIWETSKAPGVMMFRPFLYDETAGSENLTAGSQLLKFYPNPAAYRITFEVPDEIEGREILVDVFDAAGRLVDHRTMQHNQLDISHIPAGIYFVRMRSEGSIYNAKLVINR